METFPFFSFLLDGLKMDVFLPFGRTSSLSVVPFSLFTEGGGKMTSGPFFIVFPPGLREKSFFLPPFPFFPF